MTEKKVTQAGFPDGQEYEALKGLKLGFALTGSHCTLERAIGLMAELNRFGVDIYPIISDSVRVSDTRFGKAAQWREKILASSGKSQIIDSIILAETIGPGNLLDMMLIAPCSGNTLAKLAAGISDSPVLMSAKASLRNQNPLVVAISTNDGLSGNAKNIGQLLNTRNYFFVPYRQDDPYLKANSLIADFEQIPRTLLAALERKQVQPLFLG